jgi:MFS family permease
MRRNEEQSLAILTLASVAFSFQQTMMIPALPVLRRDFHASTGWVTWLFTGFLLTASVVTPLFGRLGDQYGKERLLLISLSVFFVGSLTAVFAWDLPSLIASRMLQGCSAAIYPLSFAIIKDEFSERKVGLAVGVVSSAFGVGGGLGLALSGVILDGLSWRYLFVVGAVPVGFAAFLVHKCIPESPVRAAATLDVAGAAVLSGTLVCLLLGLTEGPHRGWSSPEIFGLFGGSAALFLVWVAIERRSREPMVDLSMLMGRTVLLTNCVTLVGAIGASGTWVLIPTFVQTSPSAGYGFGASATRTGLYLMPGALAGLVTGPLGAYIGRRHSSTWSLFAGVAVSGSGLGLVALWHNRPWQVIVSMIVLQAGVPVFYAAVAKLVVDAVRPFETGVATGMNMIMRTIGGVIGAQAGAAVIAAVTIAGTDTPSERAFTIAFSASAVVTLTATVLTPFLRVSRRDAVAAARS